MEIILLRQHHMEFIIMHGRDIQHQCHKLL